MQYSSRILRLISELKNAERLVSETDRESALLLGLPRDYEVTVVAVMSLERTYNDAVAWLIDQKPRLCNSKGAPTMALLLSLKPASYL